MSENDNTTSEVNENNAGTIDRRSYLKLAGAAGTGLGTGIGASALGAEFATSARAAVSVIDDFTYNSGDHTDRYKFDQSAGTVSRPTVSTVSANDDDSRVLELADDTVEMNAFKDDGDINLNTYPNIGETFTCWIRGLNGTENMNFMYGVKGKDSKYYVKLNLETGDVGLFQVQNGSGGSLAGDWGVSTIQNNTDWFKIEVDWTTDHQHTITLWQNGSKVTSFSYTEDSTDPQYTANGVGFAGYLGSGESTQFDYATKSGSSNDDSSGPNSAIIDDFNDEDLSSYSTDRGSKSDANFVSSPSFEGNKALEISGTNTELFSLSGLNTYPTQGDQFSYWVRGTGGADDINLCYGVQDTSNQDRYLIRVDFANDELEVWRVEGGSAYVLGSENSGFSLTENAWYEIEVKWEEDGSHGVNLYDINENRLVTVTGADSTWTNGGVGYDAYLGSGGTVYFDYVTKHGMNYTGPTSQKTATRFDEHEYQYSVSENNWYRIESTIRCLGGYKKSNGMWGTTFRNSAYGVARRYDPSTETPKDGDQIKVLDTHSISYFDENDGNSSTFGYKYDEGYLGGWPTPQATKLEIAESVLESFFEITIGELSKKASLILAAADVYENARNTINEEKSSIAGENQKFVWDYGDGWTSDEHADVLHFSEVDYEQEYDSVSTFFVESVAADGSAETKVNWRVDVDAPSSASSVDTSSISTSSSTESSLPFSKETREKYGLRKIPVEELKSAGVNLDDPQIVDGNKVWFATNPQMKITTVKSNKSPF
jgi:hypothetical protein